MIRAFDRGWGGARVIVSHQHEEKTERWLAAITSVFIEMQLRGGGGEWKTSKGLMSPLNPDGGSPSLNG